MIIWHRNRRGRGGTTPRCRSRNIANNTFSEDWLQKSNEFAGLQTAPATHHAKNTANTTFSCGMLQNAGFGTIPCGGGGGGGSEPRTGIIYIYALFVLAKWSIVKCRTSSWLLVDLCCFPCKDEGDQFWRCFKFPLYACSMPSNPKRCKSLRGVLMNSGDIVT